MDTQLLIILVGITRYGNFNSGFSWDKHKLDLILGIVLSGQTGTASYLLIPQVFLIPVYWIIEP